MNKIKQYYPGYLIGMPRSNIFVKAVTNLPKTFAIALGFVLTLALGVVLKSSLSALISQVSQFIRDNLLN